MNFMNILIIKLGAIGDAIRTTSILPGLKDKYPNCRICWVTKKESLDILKSNSLIEKTFTIEETKEIIKNNYELVVSLDDDNNACSLASSVKSKKIIGAYMDHGKKAYTEDSSLWFDMGLISRLGKKRADDLKAKNKKTYQEIMYKIIGLEYKNHEHILILSSEEEVFGKNFAKKNNMKKGDIVIGINTGAGGRWQDKKLSIEETALLIDKINNKLKNAKLLLFGGPEEVERNKKIKESIKTKIIDAGCNNSLMEFASLVNLCDVLVTSDSLALHIGTALKKKIVVFFGPTSSSEIELYSRGIKIIPKIGCLCCYKPRCDIKPVYEVDEMVKAVKRLLSN